MELILCNKGRVAVHSPARGGAEVWGYWRERLGEGMWISIWNICYRVLNLYLFCYNLDFDMTLISCILLAICHVHAHSLGLVVQSFGGGGKALGRSMNGRYQQLMLILHPTSRGPRSAFFFWFPTSLNSCDGFFFLSSSRQVAPQRSSVKHA